MVAVIQQLLYLTAVVLAAVSHRQLVGQDVVSLSFAVVDAVLATVSQPRCSVMFITDGASTLSTLINSHGRELLVPWGVSMWEVAADGQDANVTLMQLSRVVDQARRLRQVSWCVTVVVVSDDLAFLAAFAQWSLKGRLVGPATRLLAVTNASLVNNPDLSRTYSMMNAMMLVVEDFQKCGVYLHVPYSPRGAKALKVAFWTPHQGLALTSSLPLFPDKFSKLSNGPTLIVVTETYPTHEIVLVDDSKSPGGKRLEFFSPIANVLQLLANVTNFTYLYMRPPDGLWGSQQNDGSWSGMVGMVSREEVDVGLGPFSVSASRAEVVDFTWPISVYYGKILGGRGRLVVDPWGFVLPLTPLVWAAILATLLVLPLTVSLLSSCVSVRTPGECIEDTFRFITIFLHQGGIVSHKKWWWERVVMLVWMMVTLVLTQSYAGNLMALLAVRHIPQPIQSLLDILHDQSATIIVEAGSTKALYFLVNFPTRGDVGNFDDCWSAGVGGVVPGAAVSTMMVMVEIHVPAAGPGVGVSELASVSPPALGSQQSGGGPSSCGRWCGPEPCDCPKEGCGRFVTVPGPVDAVPDVSPVVLLPVMLPAVLSTPPSVLPPPSGGAVAPSGNAVTSTVIQSDNNEVQSDDSDDDQPVDVLTADQLPFMWDG
nr:uncharacterized protein LOC123755121 [Procambarus clarkii]